MTLPQAIAIAIPFIAGVALLRYALLHVGRLVRFHRNSVRILAKQLPDHADRELADGALDAAIYQRQASFHCPFTRKKRVVTECVSSSRQSGWMEGMVIGVRVSRDPPHEAVIATFRNLYMFPAVYLVTGTCLAFVLPYALLAKH